MIGEIREFLEETSIENRDVKLLETGVKIQMKLVGELYRQPNG